MAVSFIAKVQRSPKVRAVRRKIKALDVAKRSLSRQYKAALKSESSKLSKKLKKSRKSKKKTKSRRR